MIIQHSLGFLHQPSLAADLGSNLRQNGSGERLWELRAEPAPLSTTEDGQKIPICLPPKTLVGSVQAQIGEGAALGLHPFLGWGVLFCGY
jgi:hypothetical protein